MSSDKMYTVYILHFDRPYWLTAQHYVGYTSRPLEKRMEDHRSGRGSKICRYAMQHGIGFQVVYTEEFPVRSSQETRVATQARAQSEKALQAMQRIERWTTLDG